MGRYSRSLCVCVCVCAIARVCVSSAGQNLKATVTRRPREISRFHPLLLHRQSPLKLHVCHFSISTNLHTLRHGRFSFVTSLAFHGSCFAHALRAGWAWLAITSVAGEATTPTHKPQTRPRVFQAVERSDAFKPGLDLRVHRAHLPGQAEASLSPHNSTRTSPVVAKLVPD